VVPSLDAVPAPVFRRVNRPQASLDNRRIIEGLVRFREEFPGELRLEIMLVEGVNDTPAQIRALKAAVARIRPDRIELNTVVRPPADRTARPLSAAALAKIRAQLGPKAEIVASFAGKKQAPASGSLEGSILATVGRRPQTAADIALALGRPLEEVVQALSSLRRHRQVGRLTHGGQTYFSKRPA
jgi:wyosine [tRNA(Phe)-imidazoG37] synthetase (radical SAM superfamily)